MDYKIDVKGVQEILYVLKNAEGDLYKKMVAEIKNEPGLLSAVSEIRSRIPSVSPLTGMNHSGRTAYGGARVSVSFKPSVRLGRSNERALVSISTTPTNGVGFEIIDLVGKGPKGNSAKALGMKQKLVGLPSRYVWKGFEERKDGLTKAVKSIIDRYAEQVNVKLR